VQRSGGQHPDRRFPSKAKSSGIKKRRKKNGRKAKNGVREEAISSGESQCRKKKRKKKNSASGFRGGLKSARHVTPEKKKKSRGG